MRIVTVLGTSRPGNYTGKALALVRAQLRDADDIDLDDVDAADLELAFPGMNGAAAQRLQDRVRAADGLVLATPEYHGSVSAATKLIIENLGFPSVLAGKPIVLLGVAAGRIGAIKALEQLLSICVHVGAIVLPGPVSVARVRTVFDEAGRCSDPEVEQQLRGLATRLVKYVGAAVCPSGLEHSARSSD